MEALSTRQRRHQGDPEGERGVAGCLERSRLGGLCSVLGGYVSARIARHDEVLNGALASILCVGLGIYAAARGTGHLWLDILYLPLGPALAALGGYLRSRQAATAG
ncbi:hypothetical protein ACFPFP_18750 [Bradyrhizobium sp. GCM10023182]|uniref:Uncharacterized protein n=1 Tax=Bradyrhizobium zhengyangense TaxID=2911009 RepID=A0ABS9LPR5_9BRAD|nr:hypothetical protein [Bradyrhizobium zhengyangense]MCG2641381.1 hypothetical protein [Bradyrhizobium zhengyangense]MCG2668995.1 hypothetical protein [Bradyrhizobium zhengyangense]